MSYLKNKKSRIITLLIIAACFICILIFVRNNYFLYSETIVRAVSVTETAVNGNDPSAPNYTGADTAPNYIQKVKAEILNGPNKGKAIEFENKRTYSGLFDFNISKGNEMFVYLNKDLTVNYVIGFKRDFTVALIFLIFCYALILVAPRKSLPVFLSLLVNALIFALILFLHTKNLNIFLLFIPGAVLFTCITLLLIGGFNIKTAGAVLSTLISVAVMMAIAGICLALFPNDIHYETVDYAGYISDFRYVFYSGLLVGGLGAIMDIAITMSASVNELLKNNPEISSKELKRSTWTIAQDLTGTLMNVLLFSCVAGAVPLMIFIYYNGMPLSYAFGYYGSAQLTRALIGCIGIVLAGPVSYFVNINLRGRWREPLLAEDLRGRDRV